MSTVTLLATAHTEKGMCNSQELLKILIAINPDVVFVEHSEQSHIQIYAGRLPDSLESKTIKMFLSQRNLKHIPVDMDGNILIDKKLKESIIHMRKVFDQYENYQYLKHEITFGSINSGFPFLNSKHCEALLAQKYFLEQKLAELYEVVNLREIHQQWIRIHSIRERHMVSRIYEYASENDFTNAVFLVGAEHRKPIMDLVTQIKNDTSPNLNWNFSYFEE